MHDQAIQPSKKPTLVTRLGAFRNTINWVAAGLALIWLVLVATTLTPEVDDFKQFWQASVYVITFGDPYATTPNCRENPSFCAEQLGSIGYFNPPIFAYLMVPFGWLDQETGQWLWFAINCLALGALIWLCLRISNTQLGRNYWGLVLLATVLAPPTRLSLQLGQLSILLPLMLIAGFAMARRRPWLAGLLVALAGLIKLYPFFIGGYYLFQRSWRLVLLIGGFALGLLAASLIVGVEPYLNYIDKVVLGNFYPYAAEHNISFFGFWMRIFADSRYAIPITHLPEVGRMLALLASVMVFGACLWFGRNATTVRQQQLHFCLWLCCMTVLSPINGYYNLVILLLPVLVVLRLLEEQSDPPVRAWLIIGVSLSCIPPTWTEFHPWVYNQLHIGWGLLLLTPSLYGLLMIIGLLLVLIRREARASVSHLSGSAR
jgi:hypothetical protein